MAYTLDVHRRARRSIEKLAQSSPSDYSRIAAALDRLAGDPRSSGAQKLSGRGPLWRVRVGEYRIVYGIFDPDYLVTVEYILRRSTRTYKDT